MIIAINARTLRPVPHDGIGWFTLEVVRGIVRDHPEHRFVLIGDRSYDLLPIEADNVEYITIPLRTVHPLLWQLWHERLLPGVLRRCGADIFIAPDGMMPLRKDIPCIPVIHDLNHEHRPEDIPGCERRYYRRYFPRFARRAARVTTVSRFSADDIASTYGINREKIDVVPNGVAEIFSPPSPGEAEATRSEFTDGRPYFLFVSNFSPRKNVEAVISAYNIFRSRGGGDHLLLLAGRRLYLTREFDRALASSPYGSDIRFTGSVGRDVLRRLYGGAEALLFVPWLEGFGIPVVEAQRCGTPCILSDTTSLPEVSGGAALCVSPADAEAIAAAMARLITDEALRRRLTQEGITNSLRYTWQNAATEMWNCICQTLNREP
ncbi:MAG: glycosyltransferase family 1 protein [Bacteroidales bacterium]|nr:glycosyltransferase family 1 protein [Bacteroidales bacterium]MDT8374414.1 glycosyltransferase family 1 protein [Bacteroidales bacterium]